MYYVKFSLLFILFHSISYTIAGIIALKFSKDIYETKGRLCTFLRDTSNKEESKHVEKYFLLAQIPRGFLMSVVLFPLLNAIGGLSFGLKFVFFSSLTFIYTHIASSSPFMDNIEGLVYFKKEYLREKFFFKFQTEMLIYSTIFGFLMSLAVG